MNKSIKIIGSFFEMAGDKNLDKEHEIFKEVVKVRNSNDSRIIALLEKQLHDDEMCRAQNLFPIHHCEYDVNWAKIYKGEETLLKNNLGEYIVEINHCGSTAIEGLPAKPIIDIFMTVKKGTSDVKLKANLEKLGYGARISLGQSIVSTENKFKEPTQLHIKARKGYTLGGLTGQVFHLHIADSKWRDAILFRDYLRNNPKVKQEYYNLKKNLKEKDSCDANAYSSGKNDFIKKYIEIAKVENH